MSWLIRLLGPRIQVDVSPERFVWRNGDREVTLKPLVHLDADRDRILAIGDPPAAPHTSVHAFDRSDPLATAALEKFVKYGIERILGRWFTIKPNVRVTGLARLGADDAKVIEKALRRSGAGVVEVGE